MIFKFVNIKILMLIWLVPVLLLFFVYGARRRERILSGYTAAKVRNNLTGGVSFSPRRIKAGLILSAVLMMAVALSGPLYGYKWQEIEQKGIDIIIALDCSRSMLAGDIPPTRLARAKREVIDLLGMLKGDRVGLVAFAGSAFLQCPLTLDYEAFHLFLNTLSPDFIPVGGSRVAAAIDVAAAGFGQESHTEKAIILITDGESTEGDTEKAAKAAAQRGIKVFTIGIGSEAGIPVPSETGGFKKDAEGKIVLTRIDETQLQKIADLTGGTYVRSVAGDMDLDRIYTGEIRGKMEQSTLAGGKKRIWEDRYQWFALLALVFLIAELFSAPSKKTFPLIVVLFISLNGAAARAGVPEIMERGQSAYAEKKYEEALNAFIEAQLEDPENPRIYYDLGHTYYRMKEFAAARDNFARALAAGDEALAKKAHYNLGNTHFRMGNYEDALKAYEEALKIDPDDKEAENNIAFVKKVMAQPKKKQEQEGQDGKKKGDKEGEDSQEKDGNNKQGEESKGKENGQDKKRDAGGKNEGAEEKSNGGQGQDTPPEEKGDEDASGQEPGPPEPIPEGGEPAQAKPALPGEDPAGDSPRSQQLLNRLQDQPGKAMVPRFDNERVLKDW